MGEKWFIESEVLFSGKTILDFRTLELTCYTLELLPKRTENWAKKCLI